MRPCPREPRDLPGGLYRRVRVTVHADGTTIIREGHGTGEGRGTSPGEVHDIALKVAETDATKRALATFGKPFGLELYRGGKAALAHQKPVPSPSVSAGVGTRVDLHPDDTTPIPRPSHYYGRRQQNPIARHFREERRQAERSLPTSQQQLPDRPDSNCNPPLASGRIDESVLTIAGPKRSRDKAHL